MPYRKTGLQLFETSHNPRLQLNTYPRSSTSPSVPVGAHGFEPRRRGGTAKDKNKSLKGNWKRNNRGKAKRATLEKHGSLAVEKPFYPHTSPLEEKWREMNGADVVQRRQILNWPQAIVCSINSASADTREEYGEKVLVLLLASSVRCRDSMAALDGRQFIIRKTSGNRPFAFSFLGVLHFDNRTSWDPGSILATVRLCSRSNCSSSVQPDCHLVGMIPSQLKRRKYRPPPPTWTRQKKKRKKWGGKKKWDICHGF